MFANESESEDTNTTSITTTSTSLQKSPLCHHFSFPEILSATKEFDESLVVGSGGFGKVYKGNIYNGSTLNKSTRVTTAIKRLDVMSNQGALEFWAEVEMLSKLRHYHIVSLIGYCNHEREMILVYEFMPNGTLEDHLHKLGTRLSWCQRLKMCIDAARGLDYLHTGGTGIEFGIIHRDVKSSNILLDKSWVAKVSDFGLSKLSPRNQASTHVSTLVKGTFGYIDPYYFNTGKLTGKSDVYAFGVILFEVLCRKRALDRSLDLGLATWAQDSIKEGRLKSIVDFDIRREISTKCLKGFARIAEKCLNNHPKNRPTMSEVVHSLEHILALQEKTDNLLQNGGKTIFGQLAEMFSFFQNSADPPADVKEAFRKYSNGGIHMEMGQLRLFIVECQGGNGDMVSISDVERILEQILSKRHPITWLINRETLALEDFHHYLFNSELNPPIGSQVCQDMTAPLSHYFIYTGHNSYLTGNQLSSPCSDVPVIEALKRGVRVIDLDLWPNSSRDNVNVVHGRTLTSPVGLLKCLRSIKEHAFTASPYPVVITLKDHLTPNLQARVAQMVTETFGNMLFCPDSDELTELPSPEALKNRILISTKPPKEYLEAEEDDCTKSQRVKDHYDDDDDDVRGKEPSRATSYRYKNNEYESVESEYDNKDLEYHGKRSDSRPAYKLMIAIHADKLKGGLEAALRVEKDKVRRLNLSEQALEKVAERHQQQIIRFTQNNILRIYPKGTRFTSSNYKPLIGWLHGAQMIAFNMQGYGRALWLMHGMFRANGGCGYVKKPDFLMENGPNNEVFDPKAKLPVKTILKVKIYMGDGWHRDFKETDSDAYSPPGFYTKVGISGVPADEIMRKTKVKKDKRTPVWNEEFTFKLTLPEIALLRIEVLEYDMSEQDDFRGQTCLPVSELRPGIRAVPLYNRKGNPYTATRLLMRFQFQSVS